NDRGYLLRETFSKNGAVSTDDYTYTEDNKLLLHTYEGHDITLGSDELGSGRVEYTYDAAGHLLSEQRTVHKKSGDRVTRTAYTYNEAGHLLTVTDYAADGTVSSLLQYTVDDAGNILSRRKTDGKGRIAQHIEYTLDAAGAVVREVEYQYNTDNEPLRYTELLTDGKGHQLSKLVHEPDGTLVSGTVSTRNEAGLVLEEATYVDGKVCERAVFTYDEAQNLLTRTASLDNGLTVRDVYRYEAVEVPGQAEER
ncbi:MAG: hypothetical protein IJF59_03105, partial [Clostridia bacterium]|nr:hypothetical protein [Clostridia bacterium]